MMYACGHNSQGLSVPKYWELTPNQRVFLSSGQCPECISQSISTLDKTIREVINGESGWGSVGCCSMGSNNNGIGDFLYTTKTENHQK